MAQVDFSSMTALVVDDEKFSSRIVCQILKQLGFKDILEARDGGQAQSILEEPISEVDVVVADFNMPQVTGLQLLKAVRCGVKKVKRDIPLIMLTGNTDSPLVAAAIELDVDAFIAKPVSKVTLENKLERCLRGERPIKDVAQYEKVNADIKIMNAADEKKDIEHTGSVLRDQQNTGREVLITRVPDNAVLSRPIRLSNGKTILNTGSKLNTRLLEKIRDLNGVGEKIETVWIE
jgi:two-component system chemotaxis response regulator CheY